MSVERSFEAWEEVQRHGLDLADKLAQGFSGLIHSHISPPSFPWPPLPNPPKPPLFDVDFAQNIFPREFIFTPINGSLNGYHNNPIVDIGNRIGQAGAEFGGFFNGLVQQVMGVVSIVPFLGGGGGGESDKGMVKVVHGGGNGVGGPGTDMSILIREDLGSLAEQLGDLRLGENEGDSGGGGNDDVSGFNLKIASLFGKSQGSVNITSAYDSRSRDVQNSIVARGDLWRLEASSGGSTSGTENSSLFLVQLGPLLFIRDTTFLLPIHLSKRHLLWYGYDKKNGLHSICPAVWSKHRRWLVMSMICLNPFACSFMDVQFPNGQLTYVAGEGLNTSAFLPICGGLLQVQGQYPGEMRFSFSCKNKWGTRVTPMVQWPDKSLALGFTQDLAWKRSGLLVRPTIQFNLCPTIGGSDPGVRAELIHSVKEQLSLIYGCSCSTYPSAYASVSLGRSKWNGNVGNTGVVLRVETPLNNVGRPAFSVQLNSGIEF
ncbi:uncharacterized protein LOC141616902 [Silene latifolia]|uniref:uncharacterized protein LOC141616902 n=1 Tax=Silene latifolia TaxID=37657 RepID=UPI003D787A3F